MPCQDRPRRDGPAELQALKESTGLSDAQLGHLAGRVSHVTFRDWRLGQKMPSYPFRVVLEVFTSEIDREGKLTKAGIPLDAWDATGREDRIIESAKPLAVLLAERG